MKSFLLLMLAGIITTAAKSQAPPLLQDKENLFTAEERNRLDSFLNAYRNRTGNLVAVYTDTADISSEGFTRSVQEQYGNPLTDKHCSFILLMSRKNSFLSGNINQPVVNHVNEKTVADILETGFASFKEKRRAEGVILICKKAMEVLDQLQKDN